MADFIKRLPLDIILQIIPYTYNLQNKKKNSNNFFDGIKDLINKNKLNIQK
jgi:hypothetical protein